MANGPLAALGADDREWLDGLYKANFRAVFRLCSRVLTNPDDAADASQEVFLVAAGSMPRDATGARSRAWLLTVARNHCLDLLRRRQRLGRAMDALGARSGGERDIETAVADRDFVDRVFRQLSARERQALWHSVVEHRPLADIADRLRLNYMAAAQAVRRARRHAVELAARVAIFLGALRLFRKQQPSVDGSLLAGHRLLVAAVVPLLLVATQTASSHGPARAAPPALTVPAGRQVTVPVPAALTGKAGGSPAASTSSAVTSSASGAGTLGLSGAARSVNSILGQVAPSSPPLPGVAVPPLPGVTIPPPKLP